MRRIGIATLLAAASLTAAPADKAAPVAMLQRVGSDARRGTAAAVRAADAPLVFTGQVFAAEFSRDARAQAEDALRALDGVLAKAGSELARVARLTGYAGDDHAVAAIEAAVAVRFAAAPVAFTVVRTPLARAGALVALEAVAWSSRAPARVEVIGEAAAVLPAGGKIFISGQAEKGADLASGVKLTMAALHRSLAHLGLKPSDVVQVKAFIRPFSDHAAAVREAIASFDGAPAPPVVVIEWVSDLFAEIELVASAPALPAPAGEPITHSWLPWLTKSPRYCHVAFVPPGTPLIFIGGIDGDGANDPRAQMKAIFERLGSVLFEAGSSYRNLAKATYYLNDPTARALLGDIRGVYFDPMRPPAASALNVNGLGRPGRAAMIDLIAVPVK